MQGPGIPRSRGTLSVAIVDDHPLIRAGLKDSLARVGVQEVVEAADGRAALDVVRAHRPQVLILDLFLPHINGIEVMKVLLGEMPELKILAFSTREDPWLVREVMNAGAAGYVFKRSPANELVHAVQQVAAGKTYIDRSLADDYRSRAGRRTEPKARGSSLSQREAEVLRLVARGLGGKEAALSLKLSPRTLETYKARAMQKLQLRTRADLIRFAEHSGWLQESEELASRG